MNTGSVRKGILSHNGLVGLRSEADGSRKLLARGVEQLGIDCSLVWHAIGADAHCHYDLFKRCVACTLSDAVDCALHLASASIDSRNGISNVKAEIIVAVHREYGFVHVA